MICQTKKRRRRTKYLRHFLLLKYNLFNKNTTDAALNAYAFLGPFALVPLIVIIYNL